MSEISLLQLSRFTEFINQLSATIGLTLSENVDKSIALEATETETVRIQDILNSPPTALFATFNLQAPDKTDCMVLLPTECVQRFVNLSGGDLNDVDLESLSDSDISYLNEVATSIVRGMALALGNMAGETIDIENCSVAMGELVLPPVYAMEEVAIRTHVIVSIPDIIDTSLQLMFTPQFMYSVLPDDSSEISAQKEEFLDEESIVGMLGELEQMGKMTPTQSRGQNGPSFAPLSMSGQDSNMGRGVDLILDISLDVTVELGRVRMLIKDVLELAAGSIIELDRVAGEPVDVLVNGRLIAKGEVVVIEDNFGIRLTEIISPSERAMGLRARA